MARTCPECGWIWPKPTGACPECGSEAAPELDLGDADTGAETAAHRGKARMPWHLKLLVGALALYLGWRAFQGIEWLVHHL